MLVKRYHANDMQQAMDTVIKELGSDAVILNSRKVRKKGLKNLFKKPVYEVMVAYDPANVPTVKKKAPARGGTAAERAYKKEHDDQLAGIAAALSANAFGSNNASVISPNAIGSANSIVPAGAGAPAGAGMPAGAGIPAGSGVTSGAIGRAGAAAPAGVYDSEQLEKLDKRIDSIDSMLNGFMEKFTFVKREITYDFPEDIQELLQGMIENQVREELAHSLAKETELMMRKKPGAGAAEVLEHLVLEQIGRPEPILHKKFTQKVILVMGPTGVGKTTSIVKLAADFSVNQKKKVGLINTDTYRIGAQEQLQTYADILGIPLQVVYQAEELADALEAMSDRDIIFVDSAGKRPGDEQHKEDILNIISILKPEDILLCLSASTGFSSVKEIVDTYGFVDDYKLMITKLDETKHRGSLLNISWYSQKPLAYATTGQNVPDDIEVVDVEAIAKAIITAQLGIRD